MGIVLFVVFVSHTRVGVYESAVRVSATRLGDISPFWQIFKSIWAAF